MLILRERKRREEREKKRKRREEKGGEKEGRRGEEGEEYLNFIILPRDNQGGLSLHVKMKLAPDVDFALHNVVGLLEAFGHVS
jgi:hypothetical protein